MGTTTGQPQSHLLIKSIQLLVLPITLLIVVFIFREIIAPKNIELSAKGIIISFYLVQAVERNGSVNISAVSSTETKKIQEIAREASTLSLDETTILWVDDNPQNQEYERKALGAIGINFVIAKNTQEAASLLANRRFNVVITDFKRADDPQGGYTLLDEVKRLPNPPPLIIYTGSTSPELEAEARRHGAYAQTNMPQKLFSLVLDAVKTKK
ncbi:response regulator [Pseudomonas sichuanensis]|uniref:response regulator n=1 Tax=Pseudomonas sichuanensis TaxID=2213015 RepID=UPI00244CF27C|nr:response regulator [Pseudomonas sichuanensis]MDH0729825.1 response regulator [Pseudomonas sichuanensis]MDH1582453.1 response regulator [Pseudomonas sichuanensis]MDH1591196.1 response regulator [Pseudomonas sichuanensis]MDH1597446.1 response regulator [Pseudomonas sichuanensis]